MSVWVKGLVSMVRCSRIVVSEVGLRLISV